IQPAKSQIHYRYYSLSMVGMLSCLKRDRYLLQKTVHCEQFKSIVRRRNKLKLKTSLATRSSSFKQGDLIMKHLSTKQLQTYCLFPAPHAATPRVLVGGLTP
ncbi:MAG TPA: hypothetical protein DCP31_20890, partial [Cyanobacteria bacterium UBA8543]|nr:hypothetical protein [Cyanobacteria bacterium UBA8543]